MHEIGFIPAGYEMDLLYDTGVTNPFQSGQVAMFTSHTWFPLQGFMENITFEWDIAAMPATNGAIHTRLHDDVFAMTRSGAENPATWSVITWLVAPEQQIALCGLDAFACIPANSSTRDETLAMLEAWMPDVSWDVVFQSIAFADNPSHERWLPDMEVMDGLLLNIYYELYYSEGETNFAAYLVEVDTEAQTLADVYWATQNQ
jgi:multiple sugar transport system substrate-binding protein